MIQVPQDNNALAVIDSLKEYVNKGHCSQEQLIMDLD